MGCIRQNESVLKSMLHDAQEHAARYLKVCFAMTRFAGFRLSQQRHTARKFVDLFLWAADGKTEVLQSAFWHVSHF